MQHTGPSSPPWGIPVNIPVPIDSESQGITPWDRLRFSSLGTYHLRCWQGVFPGIKDFFITCQSRFRTADIAWFASGKNRDGEHNHPPSSFHPSMVMLVNSSLRAKNERKALLAEVKELMFDAATMYDRLTGSTTIIISSGGTTVPGSPERPEYLKASVYLPPAFVIHNPDLHSHIIDIVQHYIETVGVRTVTMWTQRARRDLGYSFTQVGKPHQNSRFNAIPSPDCNSAHYTFLGQPYKFIENPSANSLQAQHHTSSTDLYADAFGEDPDASMLEIIDLQEENRELRERIHVLEQQVLNLEEEIKVIEHRHSSQATGSQNRTACLERQVHRNIAEKKTSIPIQNVPSNFTPLQTPLSPLRYISATPSRRSHNPAQNRTPDTSFKRHSQSSPQIQPGSSSSFAFSSAQVSTSLREESPSFCGPLLPCYIDRYRLGHLSSSINLIGTYTPVDFRVEELLKLGLVKDVCDVLANAMALDKVSLHD